MQNRGKFVIASIFIVAFSMSGFAWWHQYQSGRQSAEFWGETATVLVRYAPEVHFIPLSPENEGDETTGEVIRIEDRSYRTGPSINVTSSRGMVHVRHALVNDLSFDWKTRAPDPGDWEFLLRFKDGSKESSAAINAEKGIVHSVEQSRAALLIPKIAQAFRQKRDEWRKAASNAGK